MALINPNCVCLCVRVIVCVHVFMLFQRVMRASSCYTHVPKREVHA